MADRGVIETGWLTYRHLVMPANAPATQVIETRRAFYAGATELLTAIMGSLDPGAEPTDADLGRMDGIAAELTGFAELIKKGEA